MGFVDYTHLYTLRRIVLLTVVCAILAPVHRAQANVQCLTLFPEADISSAYSIDPAFNQKQTSAIRAAVKRLRNFASAVRVPVPDIKKRSKNLFDSGYRTLENTIWMGMSSDISDMRKAIVVFAHEFGHAIFDLNVFFRFEGQNVNSLEGSAILQHHRLRIEASEAYKAAIAEMSEKYKRFGPEKREKEADIIFRNLGGDKYYKLFDHADILSHLVMAHNELFADMIAVMLTRDGDAVANVFKHPHPDAVHDLSRSFLRQVPVENFSVHPIGDPKYELLNPTRSFIWYQYLSTLDPKYYPQFIKAYISATQAHLNEMLDSGQNIRELSLFPKAEERNVDFIKYLQANIENLGIPKTQD